MDSIQILIEKQVQTDKSVGRNKFNSHYEADAMTMEDIEMVEEQFEFIIHKYGHLWRKIKDGEIKKEDVQACKTECEIAIDDLIRLAAAFKAWEEVFS